MGARAKTITLADTTVTVTTGTSQELASGNWHEAYLSLYISIASTATVNIQYSPNDVTYVPGRDVNGTALTSITVSGYYAIPGKVRHIRANVPAAGGQVYVYVQKVG